MQGKFQITYVASYNQGRCQIRFGGLVLTHNEVAGKLVLSIFEKHSSQVNEVADVTGEGAILPTWTAVDANNVKTSRELWTSMKNNGWNVDVSFTSSPVLHPDFTMIVSSYTYFSG